MFVPSKEKVASWYVQLILYNTIIGQTDRRTDGWTDGQEWTMVHNNVTFCMLTCDKTDERWRHLSSSPTSTAAQIISSFIISAVTSEPYNRPRLACPQRYVQYKTHVNGDPATLTHEMSKPRDRFITKFAQLMRPQISVPQQNFIESARMSYFPRVRTRRLATAKCSSRVSIRVTKSLTTAWTWSTV